MNLKKNAGRIMTVAAAAVWFLMFAWIIFFLARHGKMVLHSDASAEMVLADLLNKEHAFLTTNWYYSTELRVLNTQFIFKLCLLLSPGNWHIARVMATGMLLLILSVACICLGRMVHSYACGFILAFLCITPFGKWTANNISFHAYYVPHLTIGIVSFILFTLASRNLRAGSRLKTAVFAGLLCLLAFVSCLGGIRMLMVSYIPLFMTCLLMLIPKANRQLLPERFKVWLLSFLALICGVIGYLVNSKVLQKKYAFFNFEGTTFHEFDLNSLFSGLGQMVGQFGWRRSPAVSLAGVGNGLALLLAAMVLVGNAVMISDLKASEEKRYFSVFTVCAFLFVMTILSQVGETIDSYEIPVTPFIFASMIAGIFKLKDRFRTDLFILAMIAGGFVCAKATFTDPLLDTIPPTAPIAKAYEFIESQGYTAGLGTFWNTHVITEWSDGRIETWPMANFVLANQPNWLQLKREGKFPEGRFYLMASWDELEGQGIDPAILDSCRVYSDENFIICEFANGDEYESILGHVYEQ